MSAVPLSNDDLENLRIVPKMVTNPGARWKENPVAIGREVSSPKQEMDPGIELVCDRIRTTERTARLAMR